MAQWRTDLGEFKQPHNVHLFDVNMMATKDGVVVSNTNPLPVTLGSNNITITGNVNVGTTVEVSSTPENPVHVHLTEIGTSGLLNVPYLPVSGNVVVTSGNINVVATEEAGDIYSLNNNAVNTNRGWTMDDTMRPVISFRNGSANLADLIKIIEYEIGNNNASQSTIIYEWYEGDITISGAAVPAWTTFGVHSQYRTYQDKYSSNQGNTFTANGAILRHSGIIIGKNASADEGPVSMHGGTPNMLTLCMKRVDSGTKLDVWFAFTVKELA